MTICNVNILKCFTSKVGVYINIPTTTTTLDPICYLVDCNGDFIVDCECNYIVGCGCVTTSTTTTSSGFCVLVDCVSNFIVDCEGNYISCLCSPFISTTTSTSTTLIPITTSTTTTSSSPATTSTTTTSTSTTTSSTTTTVPGCVCFSIENPAENLGNPGAVIYPCGGTGPLEVTIPVGTTNYYCVVNGTVPTKQNSESGLIITSCGTSCTTNEDCDGCTEGKLPVPPGAGLTSFGDSITTDNFVSGGVSNLYTTLLANDLGVISTRYAQGSTGFKSLMRFVHQGCNGINCETLNSPMTSNIDIVTEFYGLNNVYYEANKTNNLPIVRHGCLTLMSVQWASSIVNGANSSITRTGTFIGYAAKNNFVCGRFGTSAGGTLPNTTDAIYSNTPGSYVEYTATFKHVIIGLIGGNGQFPNFAGNPIPSGVVNVYVNNILQTTINLGQQYPSPYTDAGGGFGGDTETLGPVMVPIIMPSSANRTIKIELVSGDVAIDYISVLASPNACYPVVLSEVPYVDPLIGPGWGPNGGSAAAANTYSNQKLSIVNTWAAEGFPIKYNIVNSPAGPYSYVNTTDGTHPNILGNQQVKDAFASLFVLPPL